MFTMWRAVQMSIFFIYIGTTDETTVLVTERPKVVYNNPYYIPYLNLTATRYIRNSHIYYVNVHFISAHGIGNNYTTSFSILEYRGNRYYPSFIELRFKFCDLVHKDRLFGRAMRQGNLNAPCPYPPGDYHLYNMTMDQTAIPPGFPIAKGRIVMNFSLTGSGLVISSGYIDMELKNVHPKETENNKPKKGRL